MVSAENNRLLLTSTLRLQNSIYCKNCCNNKDNFNKGILTYVFFYIYIFVISPEIYKHCLMIILSPV